MYTMPKFTYEACIRVHFSQYVGNNITMWSYSMPNCIWAYTRPNITFDMIVIRLYCCVRFHLEKKPEEHHCFCIQVEIYKEKGTNPFSYWQEGHTVKGRKVPVFLRGYQFSQFTQFSKFSFSLKTQVVFWLGK